MENCYRNDVNVVYTTYVNDGCCSIKYIDFVDRVTALLLIDMIKKRMDIDHEITQAEILKVYGRVTTGRDNRVYWSKDTYEVFSIWPHKNGWRVIFPTATVKKEEKKSFEMQIGIDWGSTCQEYFNQWSLIDIARRLIVMLQSTAHESFDIDEQYTTPYLNDNVYIRAKNLSRKDLLKVAGKIIDYARNFDKKPKIFAFAFDNGFFNEEDSE